MFSIHHWITPISVLTPTFWKKRKLIRLINRHLYAVSLSFVSFSEFYAIKHKVSHSLAIRYFNKKYFQLVKEAEAKKVSKPVPCAEVNIFIDQVLKLKQNEEARFTTEDLVNDTSLLISAVSPLINKPCIKPWHRWITVFFCI